MNEVSRIRQQLHAAVSGEAWHGPAVDEVLVGVDLETAADHPIVGAHSIWELLLHVTSTYRLVLRRLAGDAAPLTLQEDWPPVPAPTPEAWAESIAEFHRRHGELLAALESLPDARLDELPDADSRYTLYQNLHGLVQHNLYHLGQIVLLKRA